MSDFTVSKEEYLKAKIEFEAVDKKFDEMNCSWGGSNYSPEQMKVMKEWDRIVSIVGRYEMENQVGHKLKSKLCIGMAILQGQKNKD